MTDEKIVVTLAIALVIDILLNIFWPITILRNLLFDTLFKIASTLAPQHLFLFYLIVASLLILEYVIIFVAVLSFGDNPIRSIKNILGIEDNAE